MVRVRIAATWGVVLGIAILAGSASHVVAGEGEFGIQFGAVSTDKEISGQGSETEPVLGLRGGYHFGKHWGLMVDLWLAETDALDTGLVLQKDVETLAGRLGFEVLFGPSEKKHRMFLDFGGGKVNFDLPNGTLDRSFGSLSFGQRLSIGEQKYLRWELRGDHTFGDEGFRGQDLINPQFLLGLTWGAGGKTIDADGDGIPDRKDKCSNTLAGARVDARGCTQDSDGDNVADGIDQCPDTPRGWPVDDQGCPKDSDGDGVADANDECSGTASGANVDAKGCPKDADNDGVPDGIDRCANTPKGTRVDDRGCPLDSDGDGVSDDKDRCADTARGVSVDARGCPKDSDGDGVPDSNDECPDTPQGFEVSSNGCPKVTPEELEKLKQLDRLTGVDESVILEGVNFDFNKSDLTPNSRRILDLVAQILQRKGGRWEVGGHTDSVGNQNYNQWLSERRAEAVRDYLISRNVDAAILSIRGYGPAVLVGDNSTAAGRALNRRVELKKLE